jgi:hypothetical protein
MKVTCTFENTKDTAMLRLKKDRFRRVGKSG